MNTKFKCAVIDDDNMIIEVVKNFIDKIDYVELVGIYPNPAEALNNLKVEELDFLILDVEMPELTGIEFIQSLAKVPPLILMSSKKEYGVDAFEHNAVDYLHKPFNFARFMKAIQKVKITLEEESAPAAQNDENIYVKKEGVWEKLITNDILYVKADNDAVIVYTADDSFKVNKSLKDFFDRLPQDRFMRIHRSYVVQFEKIDKLDGEVIAIGQKTFPVSKSYINELYDRLNLIK